MVNGRFLGATATGVHRVAAELVRHMDVVLTSEPRRPARPWSLVCPRNAVTPLALNTIDRRRGGVMTWQAWEQVELPRIARGAVLVNLCNLAPLAHPRCVTMIHDAQVFLSPESYSRPFLAWYRFALPRIGRSAARVVTVSEYSRERLAEFGVAPREKISVVPNGGDHLTGVDGDPSILGRLRLTPGRFVIAAANAQKHKNVALLFKVFTGGAMVDLPLVLIGADGREDFEAAGTPAPPEVMFAGRVSDGELRALYEAAACLAFPSKTEGFGLPPLEAMSLGCPAVVAPCGAVPEVCGDAVHYASSEDAAHWARVIRMLAEGGEAREEMRQRGWARAARYRWRDSARELRRIIECVA